MHSTTTANGEDTSAYDHDLGIPPGSGVYLRSLISVHAYRWNIVREWSGDDIELFFRFPIKARHAVFTAPRGLASAAARVTASLGGLSFPLKRTGSDWEFKAVFGYRARLTFWGGRIPLTASAAECRTMAFTYSIQVTL